MELSEIREHLDRLDNAMLILLAERMSLIPKVAEYKVKNGLPLKQPEREMQIFAAKCELARKNNLDEEFVKSIYKIIIEESLRIEEKIKDSAK